MCKKIAIYFDTKKCCVKKFATLSPGSCCLFWPPWLHLLLHCLLHTGEETKYKQLKHKNIKKVK